MTEYQLLYLRFLQLKRDYPKLNHKGHEPIKWPHTDTSDETRLIHKKRDEIEAEREFYRLEPRPCK